MMQTSLIAVLLILVLQAVNLPSGLHKASGVDPDSGIRYVLLSVDGLPAKSMLMPDPPPRLTAQCTKTPAGKLKFEVLADLGGAPEVLFFPPWKPRSSQDLYPPTLVQTTIIMEFLGYTRVKPVKRQWVTPEGLPDEFEYAAPGFRSGNMEDFRFYLQYLRSLPTLRLTIPGRGASQWETTAWLQALHAEPICGASGL